MQSSHSQKSPVYKDRINRNRKLASIQIVSKIEKHENADALEIATILGWKIVIRPGEVKVNEKVVYCEIDSNLPNADWLPDAIKKHFEGGECGEEKRYRLKTAKIRGQVSQGLVIPIQDSMGFTCDDVEIGDDVTDKLGIEKYLEEYIPTNTTIGPFPTNVLSKTDEIRIQSAPELLDKLRGHAFYSTVKCDGTSGTFFVENDELVVCSRNQIRKRPCEHYAIADKYDLQAKLLKFGFPIAIQGEICGPNIQKNPMNLKELTLYVFNVVDITHRPGRRLPLSEAKRVCKELDLEMVPIEEEDESFDDKGVLTIEDLLLKAEGVYPKTNKQREGLVYRSQDPEMCISFKVISNKFLLKNKK